jgi:hypothetical protein
VRQLLSGPRSALAQAARSADTKRFARLAGAPSDAGSLQQANMLKNASDPSLRSGGSSYADLELAGFAR